MDTTTEFVGAAATEVITALRSPNHGVVGVVGAQSADKFSTEISRHR
ncbi:MAG TPA: hypothetical protein VFW69_16840 [Mycobacterium sp.]|nr:hypothetical protein [Mycobacterium sp.]